MFYKWEFPKIRGTLLWSSYNKDPTILGTILGSPIFGNSQMERETVPDELPVTRSEVVQSQHQPFHSCRTISECPTPPEYIPKEAKSDKIWTPSPNLSFGVWSLGLGWLQAF